MYKYIIIKKNLKNNFITQKDVDLFFYNKNNRYKDCIEKHNNKNTHKENKYSK